jgi:hypothetical protein
MKISSQRKEHSMEEVMALYDEMINRFKNSYLSWKASNWKMRSMELALRQIHSEGDIDIEPAERVLRTAYEEETHNNKRLERKMYALEEVIRDYRSDAKNLDIELPDRIMEIKGY